MEKAKQTGQKKMVAKRERLITELDSLRCSTKEFPGYSDIDKMEEVEHIQITIIYIIFDYMI